MPAVRVIVLICAISALLIFTFATPTFKLLLSILGFTMLYGALNYQKIILVINPPPKSKRVFIYHTVPIISGSSLVILTLNGESYKGANILEYIIYIIILLLMIICEGIEVKPKD